MAAMTTYFETGRGWSAQVAEHNAGLMAQQPQRRRRVRTPEFHFAHHFDNSRLVKTPDPVRLRQMQSFGYAVAGLFLLVMFYGLQHFNAIEKGYRVESEKQTVEELREQNRQLRLSEAELSQPVRIDQMARSLGLTEPQPGQVVHPNAGANTGADTSAPALAQVAPPAPLTR